MNWFGDRVWLGKPQHKFKIGDRVRRFRYGVLFMVVDYANESCVIVAQNDGHEEAIPSGWIELA